MSVASPHQSSPTSLRPHQTGYSKVRTLLAVFVLVLGMVALGFTLEGYHEAESFSANPTLPSVNYIDPVKVAIAQKADSARSVLQASFLTFAVLWGVILAKKGEGKLVLGDWQELLMFFVANACFVLSWFCYAEYIECLSAVQSHAETTLNPDDPDELSIADFRAKPIDSLHRRQFNLFLLALGCTGLTLLSAHLLKEPSSCDPPSPPPSSS